MLVTALAPKIGYDKALKSLKLLIKMELLLNMRIKAGLIKEGNYNKIMNPLKMTKPK